MQWAQVATHDMIQSDFREVTRKFNFEFNYHFSLIRKAGSLLENFIFPAETNCCSEQGKLVRDPAKYPLCYPALVPKDDPDYAKRGIECFNLFIRRNTDVNRGCSARNGVQNQVGDIFCLESRWVFFIFFWGCN